MTTWQDTTSYRDGNTSEPQSWVLALEHARVCVHQVASIPGWWFTTCCDLGISSVPLHCHDLEAAKARSIALIKRYLEDALVDVLVWERGAGQ